MKKVAAVAFGTWMATTGMALAAETTPAVNPGMRPALVVIDIQNAFLPFMSEKDQKLALQVINGAITLFRQNGYPVIRVYHTDPSWGPKPDTEPFEFPKSVAILPDDPKIVKNFPSAFKKTGLEALLREKGVNALFLVGLSATGCVLATYHSAVDLDIDVFMVRDGLISPDSDLTQAVERICETVSYGAMRLMLRDAKR